jgi:LacI family transcriptional regulator
MSRKNVLLMINAYKFLDEAAKFAAEHDWRVTLVYGGSVPRGWKGDGALFSYNRSREQEAYLQKIRTARIPVVAMSYARADVVIPRVITDFTALGRMGARHLLSRGYPHFVFCSNEHLSSGEVCHAVFVDELRKSGVAGDIPWLIRDELVPVRQRDDWSALGQRLGAVISRLPNPLGVFCQSDSAAVMMLDAAVDAGLSVPSDVGILGTNDNVILCENQEITISSVNPDFRVIARQACERLKKAMAGEKLSTEPVRVPPLGIAERESTGVPLPGNMTISRAFELFNANISESYGVVDLANDLNVSPSTISRIFLKEIKSSPAAEMRKLRIRKAMSVLRTTTFKLGYIAKTCGFSSASHLSNVFREDVGETPAAWRARWA